MNDHEGIGVDVEGLVRAHLERNAEGFDVRPLFARIQAGVARPPVPRRRWTRWAGVAMATAAALLVAVSLFVPSRPVLAKGDALVREARQAHRLPIDRCYLVEIRRESSLVAELTPNLPQVRMTRLWTRGDRFWVESVRPEQRWAWGRDEDDRFWIAFGPHTAVRLEADEVPDALNLYCDLHSLNVDRLLGDVLNRFELTRETTPADDKPSALRVHAVARPPQGQGSAPGIRAVDLEIDAETKVVRRMVVRRVRNGEPFATVTYTLAETDSRDPAEYQLEGHLSDPSEIFSRDHKPQRRRELLSRLFGLRAGRWTRTPEPTP